MLSALTYPSIPLTNTYWLSQIHNVPDLALSTGYTMVSVTVKASLVAQMVRNLPAMQEIWVQSLGWEDPLEEGMTTHASILSWSTPTDREAWWARVHGITKSWT